MLVKEALKEYEGHNIKLGAKDGSAFIYIGVCNDEVDPYIRRAEEDIKLYLSNKSKRFVAKKKKGVNESQIKLDAYIPIKNRKVLEVYESCYVPNLIIILFSGEEKGKYWLEHECKTKTVNKEDAEDDSQPETSFERLRKRYREMKKKEQMGKIKAKTKSKKKGKK